MSVKSIAKKILVDRKKPIVKITVTQKTPEQIFKGKTFIITGGGSGIGLEIAKRLVNDSAKVIITGRNEEKLKKASKEIGEKCDYKVLDMANISSFKVFMKDLFIKYHHIDGLINNAGISLHEWDFLKVTPEGFDEQFFTNLKGSFFLTQKYVDEVLKNKAHGNVIFISSERGSMAECIPYGLTKSSTNSLVQGLSYKYYKQGIRFNAIAPGVTATNMTNHDKNGDLYSDNTSGRVFLPEEVAETAAFLLSDYSSCISGEIIHTNGGNHIKMGW